MRFEMIEVRMGVTSNIQTDVGAIHELPRVELPQVGAPLQRRRGDRNISIQNDKKHNAAMTQCRNGCRI